MKALSNSPSPLWGGSSRSDGVGGTQRREREPALLTPALTSTSHSRPRKLSYKDARRLEEIEGLLVTLPETIARHDAALADPDLYTRDPKAFDRHITAAVSAREQLEAIELEWLELEEKKAALAG